MGFDIFKEFKLNNIGFECHSLTVKEYDELAAHFKNINLIKTDGIIEELRAIKIVMK